MHSNFFKNRINLWESELNNSANFPAGWKETVTSSLQTRNFEESLDLLRR